MEYSSPIIALSGGVGGAKLAAGLAATLASEDLLVIANTADDFQHLNLHISPDLDSVMYALAGCNDRQRGWGLRNESWQFLSALEQLGGETWFQLGDKDLATHIQRTELLKKGVGLSEATLQLCRGLGVGVELLPMSDDPVQTVVQTTDEGDLLFQNYFVARQCQPEVSNFFFKGIQKARVNERLLSVLGKEETNAPVVICPSNPFVSVDPILSMRGLTEAIEASRRPCIAVSPIIADKAVKGPAAKMFIELGLECSALGVAKYYSKKYPKILSHFVIDTQDQKYSSMIEKLGIQVIVANTLMNSESQQVKLAQQILQVFET